MGRREGLQPVLTRDHPLGEAMGVLAGGVLPLPTKPASAPTAPFSKEQTLRSEERYDSHRI